MKKRNKYDKYARALGSVPITEYKDLLIQDKHKKLKKINPLDVMYEGSSFGLILNLFHDLQKQHNDYKKDIGHSISILISLLKDKGYNSPNVELNALIEDINNLVIIEPNKLYNVYHKNDNDYIVSSSPILSNDTILEVGERPDDFDKGYWRITDNGKWILDKKLYNEYWSVV